MIAQLLDDGAAVMLDARLTGRGHPPVIDAGEWRPQKTYTFRVPEPPIGDWDAHDRREAEAAALFTDLANAGFQVWLPDLRRDPRHDLIMIDDPGVIPCIASEPRPHTAYRMDDGPAPYSPDWAAHYARAYPHMDAAARSVNIPTSGFFRRGTEL